MGKLSELRAHFAFFWSAETLQKALEVCLSAMGEDYSSAGYASGSRSWCARKSSAPRVETSNAALSTSAKPLEQVLRQTPRVAETLLWLAQGKTNGEIATILGNSESTVKKHVLEIFVQLGVETRTAASLRALEVLSSPAVRE